MRDCLCDKKYQEVLDCIGNIFELNSMWKDSASVGEAKDYSTVRYNVDLRKRVAHLAKQQARLFISLNRKIIGGILYTKIIH